MAVRRDFYDDPENRIPEGMGVLTSDLVVAGTSFRLNDAKAFARASSCWLELEREPTNRHDPNAIRVLGCSPGWFGRVKKRFVGYVPREVAKEIAKHDLYVRHLKARLIQIFVGDYDFVEITFDILAPETAIPTARKRSKKSRSDA